MEKLVAIPIDTIALAGNLVIPEGARGLVVFAHGSGSSRFSPRNTFVANTLNQAGIATLLIDLLTEEEDEVYETRFNISLLTERLVAVAGWLGGQSETKDLKIGFFGASTGAAAALCAAAVFDSPVRAVVSRGGRPDLADKDLEEVSVPTLLIVGGEDREVIALNEYAFEKLSCKKKLEIVPGATHLFEEPGTLEEVARLATAWFKKYLS